MKHQVMEKLKRKISLFVNGRIKFRDLEKQMGQPIDVQFPDIQKLTVCSALFDTALNIYKTIYDKYYVTRK